jgi:hypothetical protein
MRHPFPTKPKKSSKGKIVLFLSLLCILLILPIGADSQEEIGSLQIIQLDSDDFPEITLQVFARDNLGNPLTNLSESDLSIMENDQEQNILSVEPIQGGLRLAFVIDPGDGSFNTGVTLTTLYEKLHHDLRIFALDRPWMLAGEDEIIVLINEGETINVFVPATTDPEALMTAYESYTPPVGGAREPEDLGDFTRASLMAALKEIKLARPGFVDRKEAVIHYTPGMRADMVDVAEEAILLGVPIHIILHRPAAMKYWYEALQPLAEVTGGEFFETYESPDIEPLFELLDSQRTQYLVTYQTSVMTSETREVSLEATGGITASTEYNYEVLPPEVQIITPTDDLISREANNEEDLPADAEPTFIIVNAQVSFPDGIQREVQGARLLVDGVAVGQGAVINNQAEITWDIRSYQSEGWIPASFMVEVVDEYGLVGQSPPQTIAIEYVPAPAPPIEPNEKIILYVSAGVALLSLGLALFLFFNRSRVGPAFQEARDGIVDFVERVTGRRTAMVARAYLVPLEGFDEPPSKSYEVYGTTAIGRSRRHADLLFHIGEEDSPISRLHCTLLDEDDHFSIRDEDSSNGSFVNGEKLTPLQPVRLHDGDILDIAPLERGGLRLMFQLARLDGEERSQNQEVRMTRPKHLIHPAEE